MEGEAEEFWLPRPLVGLAFPHPPAGQVQAALWVGQSPQGAASPGLWDPCSYLRKDLQSPFDIVLRVQTGRLSATTAPAQQPGEEARMSMCPL